MKLEGCLELANKIGGVVYKTKFNGFAVASSL